MKKLLCVCSLCFLFVIPVSIASAESDDITGHYFEGDMRALIYKGIIVGYGPSEYQPNKKISRAEFASMIVRGLELESDQAAGNTKELYKDVESDKWYYADIQTASKAGIINGYQDGTFKPNELISRQEMAVMASRAIKTKGINVVPLRSSFQTSTRLIVIIRMLSSKSSNCV